MTPPRRTLIPDAILWHEGMLLRPEHFESMNSRQELLVQQVACAGPFAWGVDLIQLDPVQLKQGQFVPIELELQLPNGLGLGLKADIESSPSCELPRLDAGSSQAVTVYAVVLPPADDSGTTAAPRFEAVNRADEALRKSATADVDREQEEEEVLIPRLRPHLQLLAGDSRPPSKFVSMPVARMKLVGGLWKQDETYMPPVQRVSEASLLAAQCAQTLAGIRKYAAYLSDRWRGMSALDRLQNQMELQNLRSLSGPLPVCDALLDSGAAHPFSLYVAFCGLAGQVAGIAAEPQIPQFSPYDHDDLLKSFAEVRAFIESTLNEGDVSEYLEVPMKPSETGFTADYRKEWRGHRMIVAARPIPGREAATSAWVQSALIGSKKLQRTMGETRVLGARRGPISSEKGLPVDAGVLLFHIHEEHSSEIRYMVPGEPLEVGPGYGARPADRPQEMTLYIRQTAPAAAGAGVQHLP